MDRFSSAESEQLFDRGSDRLFGAKDGQARTVQRLKNHSSIDLARIIMGKAKKKPHEEHSGFSRSSSASQFFVEQVSQLQEHVRRPSSYLQRELDTSRNPEVFNKSDDLGFLISSLEDDLRILQAEMKTSSVCMLESGVEKTDHIAKRETKSYELPWVDGATGFKVTLKALSGDPDLFVSQRITRPTRVSYTWNSTAEGDDVVLVPPGNAKFSKEKGVYIGVLGHERSSYRIKAKWILPRQAEYVFARKMNTNQRILSKMKDFKEKNKAATLGLTNNLRKDLSNLRSSRSKSEGFLHRKSRWIVGADFDNTFGAPLSNDSALFRSPKESARFDQAMQQRKEIERLKSDIKASTIASTSRAKIFRQKSGPAQDSREDRGQAYTLVKTLGGVDLEEPIKIEAHSRDGKSRIVRNEISAEKVRRERFMMLKLR